MQKIEVLETPKKIILLNMGMFGVTWELNLIHYLYIAVQNLMESVGRNAVMQELGDEYSFEIKRFNEIGNLVHTINDYYISMEQKRDRDDISSPEFMKFKRAVEDLPRLSIYILYRLYIRLVKYTDLDKMRINKDLFIEAERSYHKIEYKPEKKKKRQFATDIEEIAKSMGME